MPWVRGGQPHRRDRLGHGRLVSQRDAARGPALGVDPRPDRSLQDPGVALYSPQATPTDIIQWFVQRWQMEVTFEEARAHLGVETQRQWSKSAIARTTPVLLALFSLVTLIAQQRLTAQAMPIRCSAWYRKTHPTFSDALALVRRSLWDAQLFSMSRSEPHVRKIPSPALEHLTELLCFTA